MKPRILFVDDETRLCELLSLYFNHKGFDVLTAATVEQAMGTFDPDRFDLVILDLNLAGQDGLEVLRHVKGRAADLPVIIYTGLDDDEALYKRALAGRADGFIRKSGSLDNLWAEVRRLMPASANAASPRA
jgi:DNA-binding response OmpR family regulator